MPRFATILGPLAPVLALAALAAPAQAKQVAMPTPAGGIEVVDAPDDAVATAEDLLTWPGDDPSLSPGGTLFGDIPDVLPGQVQPGLTQGEPLPATTTMIPGTTARIRTDGKAAVPRDAPRRVRSLISQYNRIVGKRYRWGGGHGVVEDKAYDCSGAVGYGLIKTGMLRTTMVSGSFARWAAGGQGRWVTIYANRSHVYTEVAGLRLDTSAVGDRGGAHGVRWRPVIGARTGFKVRHPIGL